jgi:hypothetical protein
MLIYCKERGTEILLYGSEEAGLERKVHNSRCRICPVNFLRLFRLGKARYLDLLWKLGFGNWGITQFSGNIFDAGRMGE